MLGGSEAWEATNETSFQLLMHLAVSLSRFIRIGSMFIDGRRIAVVTISAIIIAAPPPARFE